MKLLACLVAVASLASACTSTSSGVEPLPGSLTYGGQPSTRLTKAPIGSTVTHQFRDQFSQEWGERYIIRPDRSLMLVSRHRIEYPDS